MPKSLTWMKDVLVNAGLKVAPQPGWEDRGHGDVGRIFGVMCHHTATKKSDQNMPTLKSLINGRSDLPGPIANLGLGRDGTYYLIAAGKSWHAGKGKWHGVVNGNTNFIGIEAENSGLHDDFPWPVVQMDAYVRGVAAILKHLGRGAEWCAGHKEYALPPGRKGDPDFDMNSFRAQVAMVLNGSIPQPAPIPAEEPTMSGGVPSRMTLRRGSQTNSNALVMLVQNKLGITADGDFGPKTEAALRRFQREHNLVPDGIVGPKTWIALDKA